MTEPAGDERDAGPGAAPAPAPARLAALPSDAWAWLLPHVRAALHELDDAEVTPVVQRVRAAPTSRLASGRVRDELHGLLAAGGPVWQGLVARVRGRDDAPPHVAALLDSHAPDVVVADPDAPDAGAGRQRRPDRDQGTARSKARLRELRDERDDLRRQLEGARARAAATEADRAGALDELAAAHDEVATLRRRLAAAAADQERAVARERRRRDAEVRALETTVQELRRSEEERRIEARRQREAAEVEAARVPRPGAAGGVAAATGQVATDDVDPHAPGRLVPGRPSRLPPGVHPGTTEAAELLLPAGRRVLVDGYNVTKQHQPGLGLEEQRAWLVRTLAALAARRRVHPTVVFDGQRAAGTRPPGGAREVTVVFTPAGISADDELVLAVEATDGPVTVVTDDRELTARLAAIGADVIGTAPFLGASRGG